MGKASPKDKRKREQLDKNYIRVMEKIFAVLEHFIKEGARQEALSFQAVAASVPFAKTTVHRILYSLQKLGYLERDSTQARYRLGPKFFELTEPAVHFRRLQSVATAVMTELLVRFSESVNLGVLDGGQVAYLSVLQSPSALRVSAYPGQRNPVHSTALGKAIAAFMAEEEAAAIIDEYPLIKMTPKRLRSELTSVSISRRFENGEWPSISPRMSKVSSASPRQSLISAAGWSRVSASRVPPHAWKQNSDVSRKRSGKPASRFPECWASDWAAARTKRPLLRASRKAGRRPPLSVDRTKSEPDSGLTRGEAGLFGRAEWSSPALARESRWLEGYDTDTDFFVWHTPSQN